MGTRVETITSPEQGVDHYAVLTIAGGVLTVPGPGIYIVCPESGSSDDLDTITSSCGVGNRVVLMPYAAATITLQNRAGNILNPGNLMQLALAQDGGDMSICELVLQGTTWEVLSGGSVKDLLVAHRTFVESAGAGTYIATVSLPINATVLDVRFSNYALWTATTSATLNVGDGDDADGYFAGIDLEAAPIANVNGAGGISSFLKDTGAGAYAGLTKFAADGIGGGKASTITATIVTVGAAGATGRSRLTVLYSVGLGVGALKT